MIACESGGDWYTFDDDTGSTYYGGWQIAISHGFEFLVGGSPAVQTAYAWELYDSGGAAHWPNCP